MADVSRALLGEERDKPPEFAFSLVSYLPPARSVVSSLHKLTRAGTRSVLATVLRNRSRILNRRIRMLLGFLEPDPDPLVIGTDPDPSIIKQK